MAADNAQARLDTEQGIQINSHIRYEPFDGDWSSLILSNCSKQKFYVKVKKAVNSHCRHHRHHCNCRPEPIDPKQLLAELGRISSLLLCGYIKITESTLTRSIPMELIDVMLHYFGVDNVGMDEIPRIAIEYGYIPFIALINLEYMKPSWYNPWYNPCYSSNWTWPLSKSLLHSFLFAWRRGDELTISLMLNGGFEVSDGALIDLYEEKDCALLSRFLPRWKSKRKGESYLYHDTVWRFRHFLDWACKQDEVDLVRQLVINHVVDINMKIPTEKKTKRNRWKPTKQTPLWIAFEAKHEKMMKMMITEGSDIDSRVQMANYGAVQESYRYNENETAIQRIIRTICNRSQIHKDSMEMIKCWVKYKTNVKLNDRNIRSNIFELVVKLLDMDTVVNFMNKNWTIRLIQPLLTHNATVNTVDNVNCTPLFYAVRIGIDAVNLLLSSGADPNLPTGFNVTTPVIEAASFGNSEIVEALLKAGADPTRIDDNGDNIWKAAVKSGDVNTVKIVYEYLEKCKNGQNASFVDPRDGWMALHFACLAGYVDVVKYLLDVVNVDVNLVDSDGMTPLLLAIDYNAVEIVKLLIEHQADSTIPDKKGRIAAKSVLEIALQCGDLDVLQYLYQHLMAKWSKERVDEFMNGQHFKKERTALHLACSRGHTNLCEYLLQSVGVDDNVRDSNWKTPMNFAIANNCQEIIQLLSDQHMDSIPVHQENTLEILDDVKEDEDDENDSTLSSVYKRAKDDASIPPHHIKASDQ